MHGLVPHRPDVQQILHLLVHHCRCLALMCLMGYLHHHNHPVSFHRFCRTSRHARDQATEATGALALVGVLQQLFCYVTPGFW